MFSLILFLLGLASISQRCNAQVPEELLYQVSIRFINNADYHICSGSLINSLYVLTVASCFISVRKSDIMVAAGLKNFDFPEKLVHVREIIKHEQFDVRSLNNDIALLIVWNRIKPSAIIGYANIEQDRAYLPLSHLNAYLGTVSGFVRVDFKEYECTSLSFQQTRVYMQDLSYCMKHLNTQYCAQDPCEQGNYATDNKGGSLVLHGKLYGLLSFKGPRMTAVDLYPIVFTSVPSYSNWINMQITSYENILSNKARLSSEFAPFNLHVERLSTRRRRALPPIDPATTNTSTWQYWIQKVLPPFLLF